MDESGGKRLSIVPKVILSMLPALAFGVLCAWPYVRWFAYPSLFDDDFLRVGSLRRTSLGESLFRPFNEHMAPLFETVSWLAWQASGRDVLTIPLAFQVSSYLAFSLTVGMLAAVAWRELKSVTTVLVCLTIFGLSSVAAETVLWFSASSFQWSASALLAAWYSVIRAADSPGPKCRAGWLFASSVAALAAPAFSAIGLLAGPVAMIRFLSAVTRLETLGDHLRRSLAPMAGTVFYLLICQQFAYDDLLATSVHQKLDFKAAIRATVQAPAAVLIPALFGQGNLARRVPAWVLASVSLTALTVVLAEVIRSRHRPFVLAGLTLIVGGYLATYATRARPEDLAIFDIQRYHLFPQIGFSILIADMARPLLSRFDGKGCSSLCVATILAGILAIAQYPRMQSVSDRNFRYPDQPRVLAATLRLETVCEREGVTVNQAMNALEPIQAPWFPRRSRVHPLLLMFANGPTVPRNADGYVRSILVGSLSIDDHEAIFGGLNATRYRLSDEIAKGQGRGVTSRLVDSKQMTLIARNQYRAGGRGSWLEFEVDPAAGLARGLVLPELKTRNDVEIWWAGEDGIWSSYRSVRWTPDSGDSGVIVGIALDRLPHWRTGFVRKIRLVIREWGQVAVGEPRFVP